MILMFAMQIYNTIKYDVGSSQTKSPNNMGAREFRKLNSFHHYHMVVMDLQRAPLLSIKKLFVMQIQKKKKPSVEQLAEIQNHLQTLHPKLKALKVKRFYTKGRVIARAKIGHRQINVNANINLVIDLFVSQLEEKLPTAIFNF